MTRIFDGVGRQFRAIAKEVSIFRECETSVKHFSQRLESIWSLNVNEAKGTILVVSWPSRYQLQKVRFR
jgi:hypothetical protein